MRRDRLSFWNGVLGLGIQVYMQHLGDSRDNLGLKGSLPLLQYHERYCYYHFLLITSLETYPINPAGAYVAQMEKQMKRTWKGHGSWGYIGHCRDN